MRHLESRSFVGRAAELAVLEEALAAAGGGHASVVLIGGEAGVGKTRLVAQLSERARAQRATVVTGACVELTAGTAPYLAITELLRDLARALPERAWERLRAGAGPELDALMPGARGRDDVRADNASRARLFGQVHELLLEAATTAPLVLVVEDVHWADRSTLDLTGFLARTLADAGVVLVGTYRVDEVPRRPPLRGWLAELARVAAVRRIELEPFTPDEVADLCAAILGAAAAPATIAEITRRSGGNAFLAEELLAAAAEGDAGGLPVSVRDVLQARIAALTPAAQDAVRAAAVAGALVDDELLAALVPGPDLPDALREAVAHHVLVPDPRDGRLSFRHELAREAAYAELLPGERRRLHAACARVLTARPALGGDALAATAAAVAGHWHAAGDERSALAAGTRAAVAAEGVHAFAEAAAQYERVLDLWERVADPEDVAGIPRLEVLERAGATLLQSGSATRAIDRLDQALALADPVADPVRTGVLHSRRAWTSWAAGAAGPETDAHHEAALRLIPAEPTPERAAAVTDLAFTQMLNGRHRAATASAREAIELACRAGDRRVESLARTVLGSALGSLGELDESIASLQTAVEIAQAEHLPEELGRAYVNLSAMLDAAGRLEESAAVALEGEQACRRLGLGLYWGAFLTGNAVEALIWLGRWDEAEALLSAVPMDDLARTAYVHLTLEGARLALYRGDLDGCEATLASVLQTGTSGHGVEMSSQTAEVAAELAIARGRPDDAREAVLAGFERESEDFRYLAQLVATGVAAEAARPHPDAEARRRASELMQLLDGLDDTRLVSLAAAETATARAELSRLQTPVPALWRAAAASWTERSAPFQTVYCRWREAEALLETGGGRTAAADPLRAAAASARDLGANGLLREIERLAARARIDLAPAQGAERAEPGAHGLTPRELEILPYLAAGRTNREIADALFISPRTTGVHVSRILAKLGASTRGEAAAAGRLAGLIDDAELVNLVRLTPPRSSGAP